MLVLKESSEEPSPARAAFERARTSALERAGRHHWMHVMNDIVIIAVWFEEKRHKRD